MHHVAVAVPEDLDLHVPRRGHVFLDEHARIAEGVLRLALGGLQRLVEIGMAVHPLHALAAATGDGLDQHRIADLIGLLLEESGILVGAMVARHHRNAGLLDQSLGGILEAHRLDGRGGRSDEDDAGLGAGRRESRVLRQESVAGMHAGRAAALRHVEDDVAAQIAVARRRRADQMRLVRQPDMRRPGIRLRIDGDGAQPQPPRRADHAAGDLAAIGDEDGGEKVGQGHGRGVAQFACRGNGGGTPDSPRCYPFIPPTEKEAPDVHARR